MASAGCHRAFHCILVKSVVARWRAWRGTADRRAPSMRRRMADAVGHVSVLGMPARLDAGSSTSRRRGLTAALVAAALLSTSVGRVEASGSPPQPPLIPRSSAIGTRSPSTRSSSMPARPTRKRSCGSRSSRRPSTTRSSASPGSYELYEWNTRGPREASPQAAAAVAAHDVLLEYFPGSQTRLDTALEASLAEIPDGRAKKQGIRYGKRAADRLIDLRADDGRFAPVTFDDPAGARGLAPDPAGVRAVLRPVDGADAAAGARVTQPVPSGPASRVDLPRRTRRTSTR